MMHQTVYAIMMHQTVYAIMMHQTLATRQSSNYTIDIFKQSGINKSPSWFKNKSSKQN